MRPSGTLSGPTHRPDGTREDRIDTLWPRLAPPSVKTAVAGIYVMVALLVVNVATVQAISPNGGIVVEDVLIGLLFIGIVVGISRRALWARYGGIAVAALFALGTISLFQSGVPGIVVVAGFVQLVVLVGVVVLLLLRPTGEWFRGVA